MRRNALFALVVGAALAAIGIRVTSAPNATATATSKAPLTPAGFSHPLVFPPVNTNANVSIANPRWAMHKHVDVWRDVPGLNNS